MAVYVQLPNNKLLKVSGDVTADNITQALGYKPFDGEFSNLKNSPFTDDNSGELKIVDENGFIIFKVDADGLETTAINLPKGDVQTQIDNIKDVVGQDFYTKDEISETGIPLLVTDEIKNSSSDFQISDENGFIIFKVDADGLETTAAHINELKNSDSDFQISDENGFIIFKVDADGLKTTAIDLPKGDVQTQIDNIKDVVGQDFYTKDEVYTKDEISRTGIPSLVTDEIKYSSNELQISDDDGYVVFNVDADGVKTTAILLPKGDVQTQIDNIKTVTIKGTDGLAGGGTIATGGTVSISHATATTTQFAADSNKFVTGIVTDKYGHISGITSKSPSSLTIINGENRVVYDGTSAQTITITAGGGADGNTQYSLSGGEIANDVATITLSNNDNDTTTKATINLESYKNITATNETIGNSKLITDDVSTRTYTDGEAAAACHNHDSTYLKNITITAGGGLSDGGNVDSTAAAVTISHGDKPSNSNETFGEDNKYISLIGIDAYGHIATAETKDFPQNKSLTIINGGNTVVYDGTSAQTITITAGGGADGNTKYSLSGETITEGYKIELIGTDEENSSITVPIASTNNLGVVQLSSSFSGNSENVAATEYALSLAYTKANNAFNGLNDKADKDHTHDEVYAKKDEVEVWENNYAAIIAEFDPRINHLETGITENYYTKEEISETGIDKIAVNNNTFEIVDDNEHIIASFDNNGLTTVEVTVYQTYDGNTKIHNLTQKADAVDLENYLPLTGGTITGDIFIEGGKISGATGFYQASDERLKVFANDVNVDFELLAEIPKKYFTWKDDITHKNEIGTSAQKIKELYPEIVNGDEDGVLSVDYSKLSIIALKAIDVLHEENKLLRAELNEIKRHLGI